MQGVDVHRVEGVADRVDRHRAVEALVEDPVENVRAGLRKLERLPQQLPEQMHGHTAVPQHLGEGVVLLLRPLHPEDVVEEQPVLVGGCEPFQLEVGPVHDHLTEPSDLGVDVKRHPDIPL